MSPKSLDTPKSEPPSQSLQPLSAVLGPKIEALQARATAVLALTDTVRMALPDPDKSHVLSASYHADTLHLATDSAAWCARIRFREEELRKRLIELGEKPFTDLKVRVGRPG